MRGSWRSMAVRAAVVLLLAAANTSGQDNSSVWSVKHLEKGKGASLTSVYSLALAGDWKGRRYVQWLWAGDENGMVRVVLDPDADGFLKINKVPTEPQSTKASARTSAPVPINDIYFQDPKHGLLLKGNSIYTSSSGGFDWSLSHSVPPSNGAVAVLNSLGFFPDEPERGCVVGTYRRNQFITDSLVLCAGQNTGDGFRGWRVPIQLPSRVELYHLDLADDRHGWIVGAAGLLLYTNDGGETWSPQDSQTRAALYHVNFTDSKHGWAVGENNTLLRTTNGGRDWQQTPVPSPAGSTLMSVKFVNSREGWVVGYKGVILYTRDGGNRWSLQDSRTKEDLYALSIDHKYCWAVGTGGVILRYPRRRES